jgi:hypothetical protein
MLRSEPRLRVPLVTPDEVCGNYPLFRIWSTIALLLGKAKLCSSFLGSYRRLESLALDSFVNWLPSRFRNLRFAVKGKQVLVFVGGCSLTAIYKP